MIRWSMCAKRLATPKNVFLKTVSPGFFVGEQKIAATRTTFGGVFFWFARPREWTSVERKGARENRRAGGIEVADW